MAAGADGQSVAALFEDGTGTVAAAHVPLLAVPGGEQELSADADYEAACCSQLTDADAHSEGSTPIVGRVRNTSAARGVCILTAEEAMTIFVARKERSGRRDQVARNLACRFGVAPRTVRDIWNLRTWADTTRPLWSSADLAREANKHGAPQTPEFAPLLAPSDCPCAAPPALSNGSEWKLCATWLVPGEVWKRDEFDQTLDLILAAAGPSDFDAPRAHLGLGA
jgi:hypothetical protein